jgi:FkbM family methyltransferase
MTNGRRSSLENAAERVKRYRNSYRNFISVMLDLYMKKETIRVVFNDASEEDVSRNFAWMYPLVLRSNGYSDDKEIRALLKKETIRWMGKNVVMHGMWNNGDVEAAFFRGDYGSLQVAGEVVIDIGANIGDSSIYFTLNGAKRVIALEPYPHSYSIARRNVDENGLSDSIILLNAGYGLSGTVTVDEDLVVNGSTKLSSTARGKTIPLLDLEDILNNYGIQSGVLKMDCEGCEYYLAEENDDVFKRLKSVQLEYHSGYLDLKKKLEGAGMMVSQTKLKRPLQVGRGDIREEGETGYLYAWWQ